jgi:hypothetical protein
VRKGRGRLDLGLRLRFLHEERIWLEGVEMHHHSPNIPHYFEHQPAHHGKRERPCFVLPQLEGLDDEEQAENGEVEGVSSEGGVVVDCCLREGTG